MVAGKAIFFMVVGRAGQRDYIYIVIGKDRRSRMSKDAEGCDVGEDPGAPWLVNFFVRSRLDCTKSIKKKKVPRQTSSLDVLHIL